MKSLPSIAHCEVTVQDDGSVTWTAPARIDGDGSGGNLENDPCYQRETTLKHADGTYLNSRTECFIVVPPEIRDGVKGIVMGCQAWVLNNTDPDGKEEPFVVGDIGPRHKLGEMSIAGAIKMKIPSSPISGGDEKPDITYRIEPGIPAVVGDTTYVLQPA